MYGTQTSGSVRLAELHSASTQKESGQSVRLAHRPELYAPCLVESDSANFPCLHEDQQCALSITPADCHPELRMLLGGGSRERTMILQAISCDRRSWARVPACARDDNLGETSKSLRLRVQSPNFFTKFAESIDTASADPIIHLPHSQKTHNFYHADD